MFVCRFVLLQDGMSLRMAMYTCSSTPFLLAQASW